MEAVERQHQIKFAVREWQRADIPLLELYVRQVQLFCLFLCLPHHVRRVVQTRHVCFRQRLVDRHGQDARADGNFQHLAREILRDAGQRLGQVVLALLPVHRPHHAADRLAGEGRTGNHAVVKIVRSSQVIRPANGVFPLLTFHTLHSSNFR